MLSNDLSVVDVTAKYVNLDGIDKQRLCLPGDDFDGVSTDENLSGGRDLLVTSNVTERQIMSTHEPETNDCAVSMVLDEDREVAQGTSLALEESLSDEITCAPLDSKSRGPSVIRVKIKDESSGKFYLRMIEVVNARLAITELRKELKQLWVIESKFDGQRDGNRSRKERRKSSSEKVADMGA